jgi:hypothetical protein
MQYAPRWVRRVTRFMSRMRISFFFESYAKKKVGLIIGPINFSRSVSGEYTFPMT